MKRIYLIGKNDGSLASIGARVDIDGHCSYVTLTPDRHVGIDDQIEILIEPKDVPALTRKLNAFARAVKEIGK